MVLDIPKLYSSAVDSVLASFVPNTRECGAAVLGLRTNDSPRKVKPACSWEQPFCQKPINGLPGSMRGVFGGGTRRKKLRRKKDGVSPPPPLVQPLTCGQEERVAGSQPLDQG